MCRILVYGCPAVVKDIVTDGSGTIISCKYNGCGESKDDDIKNEKFDTEIIVSHNQFPESHKLTFIHVLKDEKRDTKDECVTDNPDLVENYEEYVEAFVNPEIKDEPAFGPLNFLLYDDTKEEEIDVKEETSDPIQINASGSGSRSGKKLHCRKCGAAFYNISSMLKHHKKEHKEKKLISHMKIPIKSRKLRRKAVDIGKAPYTCKKCFKVYQTRQSFLKHMRSHFKCDQCIQEFDDEDELNQHKLMHTEEKTFECWHCGQSYKNIHHLITHLKRIHQTKGFKCNQCTKTFTLKSKLMSHKSIHTSEQREQPKQREPREQKLYVCEICGKSYPQYCKLKDHLGIHSTSFFNCDQCDKTFKTQSGLKFHIRRQHTTARKLYFCDFCAKEFKCKPNLNSHISRIHNNTNRVLFPCTICGKALSSKRHLRQHIEFCHMDIRNHQCEYCDSTFKTNGHLKRHMALHIKYGDHKFSRNRSKKIMQL